MRFLICLGVVSLLVYKGHAVLKARSAVFYRIAVLLALLTGAGAAVDLPSHLPDAAVLLLWEPLACGSIGSALFVLVMYAGAVSRAPEKLLRSVRTELSILASILTFGHNLAAGQTYFVLLFTDPGALAPHHLAAAVCSLVMLLLLLPLFVTSFPAVRKKMTGRQWKTLQKLAYPFYALLYVHVLLLFFPAARAGSLSAFLNLAVFSVIFFLYAALRISKAVCRKQAMPAEKQLPFRIGACIDAVIVAGVLLFPAFPDAGFSSIAMPEHSPADAPSGTPTDGLYQDGTFEGKGRGYAGPVTVQVTIADDKITAVTIVSHKEDEPYWERSLVTIDRILEEQTHRVDTVAGATKSCRGIQKAVRDALKHAKNK